MTRASARVPKSSRFERFITQLVVEALDGHFPIGLPGRMERVLICRSSNQPEMAGSKASLRLVVTAANVAVRRNAQWPLQSP